MSSVGIFVRPIIEAFHPHVVVDGARRTPLPHFAPTGSDAIMSFQTTSRTAGSNWFGHPSCRSQFASNACRDCVLNTTPALGSAGGAAAAPRL